MASNTEINETKKFICPRCGVGMNLKTNLISHLQNKTPCPTKHLDISVEDAISMFKKNQTKLEQEKCSQCDKAITKQNMKRHLEVCRKKENLTKSTSNAVEDVLVQAMMNNEEIQAFIVQAIDDAMKKHLSTNVGVIPLNQNNVKGKKKQKVTHALKVNVWDRYVGDTIGKTKCHCCQNVDITQHNFHCGHVQAEALGGTLHIDNLRPICGVCNNSMGTQNMFEFQREFFGDRN